MISLRIGYKCDTINLDLFKKFKLWDEALNTEKIRSYIQYENSRHAKVVKEAKLKIDVAKEKVKCLTQKLKNEKVKVSPFGWRA
ncbi:hypothetical protein LR48_Vigan10g182400 [Vigna angularis]|uniref:Uncharacterized protein n=1 Tax=Phaseolus angularis TaxID=3914 RepID=A0A0L9VM08_PHAAN|nr:hypothetical protein LR48_Vigan10g182400 [Vigna angularis]